MTDSHTPFSLESEVSFSDLAARIRRVRDTVLRERRMLLAPLGLAVGVGLFVAFGSGTEFSSSAKLVPYRGGAASQGGLAGLAGLAGVRIPSGMAGDFVISTDIYPEVVSTLDFRIAISETPVRFSDSAEPVTPLAYFSDRYEPAPVELLLRYTLGLPGLVLETLRSTPSPSGAAGQGENAGFRVVDAQRLKLLRKIQKRIAVTVDKRTGVVSVAASMPDPVAAASLVKATADRLTQVVMEFEVRKADEQLAYIEEQFAVARVRYDNAQRRVAAFADSNRMLTSATSQIERERLEREASLAFETFQQIAREREQARIKRSQDTPVFAVLEVPAVPTERSSPKRGQILLLSVVLGFIAGLIRVAVRAQAPGSVH